MVPMKNDNSTNTHHAERIRTERQNRGWTQEKLAELSELTPRTIQRLECGARISTNSLKQIAAALELDAEQLERPIPRTVFHAKYTATLPKYLIPIATLIYGSVGIAYSAFPSFMPTIGDEFFSSHILPLIMLFLLVQMWSNLLWLVRGFSIKDGRLRVHHPGWSKSYDLDKLSAMGKFTELKMGALPMTSLFNTFSGWYFARCIGWFRGYITDPNQCVMLVFGKKHIAVTPDDAKAFMSSINEDQSTRLNRPPLPSHEVQDQQRSQADAFSQRIRDERDKRSWTQTDLARKSGLSKRTIQRIEGGAEAAMETIQLIEQALDLPHDELSNLSIPKGFSSPWSESGKYLRVAWILLFGATMMEYSLIMFLNIGGDLLSWPTWTLYALCALLIAQLNLSNISGFSIKQGKLFINHYGPATRYDLSQLEHIEYNPRAMMGAIPLSFPLIILSPWCRSTLLGFFRAFVTNEANAIVLTFKKTSSFLRPRTIIVSPDDPEVFMQSIQAELKDLDD